jgi:hypothetical protein
MKLAPIVTEVVRPYPLYKNPTYLFLKSELERLTEENPESEGLTMKSLITQNLKSLLNEVNFTQDYNQQLSLLTKIRAWYRSKLPKTTEDLLTPDEIPSITYSSKTPQPRVRLEGLSPQNHPVNLNQTSNSPSPTPQFSHMKSFHFSNMNYLQHIKRLSHKFSEWESSRSKFNEELNFRSSIKKRASKVNISGEKVKPRWKEPIFDLRNYSTFSNGKFDSSQRLKEQISTIENIKRTLAHKRLAVSSKCLENGISLYEEKNLKIQLLPETGENLLKMVKAQSVKPKTGKKRKKSPKRKKKSKKN